MSSTYNPGRVAGFLYLLLAVAGPVRIIYIAEELDRPTPTLFSRQMD